MGGGHWVDVETNEIVPLDDVVDQRPYLGQIDSLQVVSQCKCGEPNCHTVQFQYFRPGKSAGLVCYHTEDKRQLIIHVDEDTNLLSELEII